MVEFLRLSHAATESETGPVLYDFNLSVFGTEAVLLLGTHDSGKRSILPLLRGETRLVSGFVYAGGRRVRLSDKTVWPDRRVFFIDGQRSQADSLSVAENLFVLRQRRRSVFFYQPKHIRQETREALARVGLQCEPDIPSYALTPFEQYQLCFARGLVSGGKLFVLDLAGNSFNANEYAQLAVLIAKLKEEGLAFLILDESPYPLLDACDKAVIVHEGRDIKTLFSGGAGTGTFSDQVLAVLGRFDGQSTTAQPVETKPSAANGSPPPPASLLCQTGDKGCIFRLRPGEIAGFYESTSFGRGDMPFFYEQMLRRNAARLTLCGEVLCLQDERVVFIPENSGECLHENLNLSDVLLLPRYSRVTGHTGVINPSVQEWAVLEFCEKFNIPHDASRVQDLNRVERRLLSLYRYAMNKPVLLIIDNPAFGLDTVDQTRVRDYLWEIAGAGTFVFSTLYGLGNSGEYCSKLVSTDEGRFAGLPVE